MKTGNAAVGSGDYAGITINSPQPYTFSFNNGGDPLSTSNPESVNEFKKFAGFLGFVSSSVTGDPVAGVAVQICSPTGSLLATVYTDADGHYMYAYKHKAKSATYTVKLPNYGKSTAVVVKANGFAGIDFEIP